MLNKDLLILCLNNHMWDIIDKFMGESPQYFLAVGTIYDSCLTMNLLIYLLITKDHAFHESFINKISDYIMFQYIQGNLSIEFIEYINSFILK